MFAKLTALSILALAVATSGAPCASDSTTDGLPIPTGAPSEPGVPSVTSILTTISGVVTTVTSAIPTGTGIVPPITSVIPTLSIPGKPDPTPSQPASGTPNGPSVPGLPGLPSGGLSGLPIPTELPANPSHGLPPIVISVGMPNMPHMSTVPTDGGNPPQTQTAKPTEGYPSPSHPTAPQPTSSSAPGGGNPPTAPGNGGNPPTAPGNGGNPPSAPGNGGNDNGPSQCSTGPVQCCNKVYSSKSKEGRTLLAGLMGVDASHAVGDVATGCSPINTVNVSGNTCKAQTVCCESKAEGGLVNIGCVPVML